MACPNRLLFVPINHLWRTLVVLRVTIDVKRIGQAETHVTDFTDGFTSGSGHSPVDLRSSHRSTPFKNGGKCQQQELLLAYADKRENNHRAVLELHRQMAGSRF
jgi:hypothetical protein